MRTDRIVLAGRRGVHQQDRIIMTCGIVPALTVGSHDNAAWMNLIIVPFEYMETKSLLNRYVRYIYRKMMHTYGVEKTREQALRIFTLTTPERARVKKEEASQLSTEFCKAILDLCLEWAIPTKFFNETLCGTIYTTEELGQVLLDLTPIRVRIRKLTPRECARLQGVTDEDFDKMAAAGISNSALYKLYGNSIAINCLEAIFTQLFRHDSDVLF